MSVMRWVSTLNVIPEDGEEVLLRAGGQYHMAVYSAREEAFALRSGVKVKIAQMEVQWMHLVKPESNRPPSD